MRRGIVGLVKGISFRGCSLKNENQDSLLNIHAGA